MRIIVAITGASGVVLGSRLVEFLKYKENKGKYELHLITSKSAKKIAEYEEVNLDESRSFADYCYEEDELDSSISSSSYRIDSMVIIPCSMKTMAAIANGFCDNLITRAAENILKLGKKLVVVPRDTPLSLAAIENMRKLKSCGVLIVPPNMAYYYKPKTVGDVTNFFVGKVLDVLRIEHNLYNKWKGGD